MLEISYLIALFGHISRCIDSDTIETADDGSEPSEEIGGMYKHIDYSLLLACPLQVVLSPILTSTTIRKQIRSKTAPGSVPRRLFQYEDIRLWVPRHVWTPYNVRILLS
jgi:hypothetical protein